MLSTKRLVLLGALAAALAVPAQGHAVPATTVVSSGGLNQTITDATWIVVGSVLSPGISQATLTVPDLGTVVDVNVRLRANHTYVGDLLVSLSGPDEAVDGPILLGFIGGNGDNVGSGANDCTGTFAVFDDAASTSVEAAVPPWAGTFRPEEPLSVFNGTSAGGEWMLSMIDLIPGDFGVLYCWELEITYEPPPADLFVRGSDTPDPVKVGKRVRYTLTIGNDGSAAASGVTVVDTLPRGAGFVSARASQGSCNRAGRKVTCEIGDLADGETATVTVVAKAPTKAGQVTNVAVVSGDNEDPVAANNRVQIKTKVRKP